MVEKNFIKGNDELAWLYSNLHTDIKNLGEEICSEYDSSVVDYVKTSGCEAIKKINRNEAFNIISDCQALLHKIVLELQNGEKIND